jgi:NAD+ synthase (glutamine-hydrolysing)
VPTLRIALCQINTVVGDLEHNASLVREWTRRAVEQGAHLVAFPEMTLTGYPAEDLVLRASFADASRRTLDALAADLAEFGLGEVAVVLGYLDSRLSQPVRAGEPSGAPLNAGAVLHGGKVAIRYAKHHLPNYGVFDEYRYFVPGDTLAVVRLHGVDVALPICEDLWQDGGPVAATRAAAAGLLLVINASPYERAKDDVRLDLVRRRAAEAGCALAYVNQVGGQDELVFDGDSLVVAADGALLARAPRFAEHCLVVDLELPGAGEDGAAAFTDPTGTAIHIERAVISGEPAPPRPVRTALLTPPLDDTAEVYAALITGVRDYVTKNGFRSVLIGVSGGIDSALTAAIAADAVGPEQVYAVSMPSAYSSEHSRQDAAELAERIGLHYSQVSIEPMVTAFQGELGLSGLAEENLQARVRGTTLMALSNQHGHLVLATGNKSELAVGYSTLYGDAVGGFAPLKDVPKTLVWTLARWRNERAARQGRTPPIPERSITKPPSAELRPGQLDTDSLPPYDVLDEILDAYVERDASREQLLAAGFEQTMVERVLTLVDRAEYKRRQYPPGPKISLKAFGRDRRLPITNRWREVTPGQPGPAVPARAAEPGLPGGQ